MAKGKHAAAAAIRRAEAAHEHIDRLTNQLAEAKMRARAIEAEANRVPSLVAEVARLQGLAEQATSDRLVYEQEQAQRREAKLTEQRDAAIRGLADVIGRVIEQDPDMQIIAADDVKKWDCDPAFLPVREALGCLNNRAQRRWASSTGQLRTTMAEKAVQDNRRTYKENFENARTGESMFT